MSFTAAINDPDSPLVAESLTRRCDQCRAPAGTLCEPRGGFQHDLAGRVVHYGRLGTP